MRMDKGVNVIVSASQSTEQADNMSNYLQATIFSFDKVRLENAYIISDEPHFLIEDVAVIAGVSIGDVTDFLSQYPAFWIAAKIKPAPATIAFDVQLIHPMGLLLVGLKFSMSREFISGLASTLIAQRKRKNQKSFHAGRG